MKLKRMRINYNPESSLNYSIKSCGNNTVAMKQSSEYMYICPQCGRFASITTRTHAVVTSLPSVADHKIDSPSGVDPVISIVPTEAISVTCPCGCGMIAIDPVSADAAIKLEACGFTQVAVVDPINDTGLSLNPNEIFIMDDIESDRMKKLLKCIYSIEDSSELKEKFSNINIAICNDELNLRYPISRTRTNNVKILTIDGTYIGIKDNTPYDTIRNKCSSYSNEFIQYLAVLIHLFNGDSIKDIISIIDKPCEPFENTGFDVPPRYVMF